MHNVRPPLSVLTALSRVDRVRVRVQQDTEAIHVNNVQRGSFQAAAIASNVVSIHTLQLDKVRVLRVQQARSRRQERVPVRHVRQGIIQIKARLALHVERERSRTLRGLHVTTVNPVHIRTKRAKASA